MDLEITKFHFNLLSFQASQQCNDTVESINYESEF